MGLWSTVNGKDLKAGRTIWLDDVDQFSDEGKSLFRNAGANLYARDNARLADLARQKFLFSDGLDAKDMRMSFTYQSRVSRQLDDYSTASATNVGAMPTYSGAALYGDVRELSGWEAFKTFSPVGRAWTSFSNSVVDIPNAAYEGSVNLLKDAYGYAKEAVAGPEKGIFGETNYYEPQSGLARSIQSEGLVGTLGKAIVGAVKTLPFIGTIDAMYRKDPDAFGASLPTTLMGGYGAASSILGAEAVAAKQLLARDFYENQGWASARIDSHLKGIDFTKDVGLYTLQPGRSVVQWQVPGNPVGNYFAPVGTTASELGINPIGRVESYFDTPAQPTVVLRSTAAEIVDTWSAPAAPFKAKGGGTQYFTGEPALFNKFGLAGPSQIGETGTFSKIVEGRIRSTEMNGIARALRQETGTRIVYDSPAASRYGNHFDLNLNEIHLQGGASQQRRGLFYEEVQHAFDHHSGAYDIPGLTNTELHAITAKNLVQNPLLPTTPRQNELLLQLAEKREKKN